MLLADGVKNRPAHGLGEADQQPAQAPRRPSSRGPPVMTIMKASSVNAGAERRRHVDQQPPGSSLLLPTHAAPSPKVRA